LKNNSWRKEKDKVFIVDFRKEIWKEEGKKKKLKIKSN